MRFGWLAAAAAMALGAGQASAVNWVSYEVRGNGIESIAGYPFFTPNTRAVDFRLVLTVDTDAGSYSGAVPQGAINYTSTGSVFTARYFYGANGPGQGDLTVDGSASGQLSGTYTSSGQFSSSEALTFGLGYTDVDMLGGLPLRLLSNDASGTLSYRFGSMSYGQTISGTITGLALLRGVTAYAAPTITAVPEPAAWLMMIVGFGGIGAGLRRRRSAAQSLKQLIVAEL